MEVHNGLVQGFSGIVRQQPLEAAESTGRSLEQFGGSGLEAVRVLDKRSQTPCLTGGIGVVILAVTGLDQTQGLTEGITAIGDHLLPQVRGDAHKILHQLVLAGECGHGQALQDEADAVTFLGLAQNAEGIIDVTLTITNSAHQGRGEIESRKNFLQNSIFFGNVHMFTPSQMYLLKVSQFIF